MMRAVAMGLGLLMLACSVPDGVTTTNRMALVTPGSVADAAWNAGAFEGINAIADSLGVEVSHVEAGTPVEQEEALRSYAAQGYSLVFGHGFEFQQPAERVAAEFPGTVFVITSGQRVTGNVIPLVFRIHEATYLLGMLAGGLTATGQIGFVGGMELPPIVLGQRGWEAGALAVNPDVVTRTTWLNSFDDAAAGKEAALAMIRLGADQLHHNADAAALGLFSAVRENPGALAYGANADQDDLAPGQVPGSAVIDLPRAMLLIAREVHEGSFVPRTESFGLASGVIQLAYGTSSAVRIPPSLRARVDAAADSIAAGTLVINGERGVP